MQKGENNMSVAWRYMPILKWKQGEQLALRYLTKDQWKGITPLIELQPIDAAPDVSAIKVNLPAHLNKVANKIITSIPEGYTVCLDTCYLSTGYPKQIELLIAVCADLQEKIPDRTFVPVIHASTFESLDALPYKCKEFLKKQASIVLRIRTDQNEALQVEASVKAITDIGIEKSCIHLLIDQFSLVNRKDTECFESAKPYLNNAMDANCASVTIGGGSFPINLIGKKQGVTKIPRVEWAVWNLLQKSGKYPKLRYADYTVTNPTPMPDIDPTTLNPSIAIRYATTNCWQLYKGRGFKGSAPGQHQGLCKLLVMDTDIFSGENFSYGDRQYKNAATKAAPGKNGNPSSWRKEATNHHIAFTANSL